MAQRVVVPAICRLFLGILLVPCSHAGNAQESIDYRIPRTTTSPQIDGVFSAGEWSGALMVELTNETQPRQNLPALVGTRVYIMEDGENFLAAFVAEDPHPEQIRAFYRDRDRAYPDDYVGFALDTFNDERRAFKFYSNPLGVQMDMTHDDIAGDEDDSWNALWDSAGQINATGYVVEMRVPLKQLRFPSGLAEQTWGIDLLRVYPRDQRHQFSSRARDYAVSCFICQFKKAQGLANLQQGTNLQVIPAVTARGSETRPDPAAAGSRWTGASNVDAGADLRWGINADMILNATLNPDFSQVEADNAQLDVNNTFSLFFPEKREFFLDGAEYFNTNENLVYTRNINDPDYGVKLTGKSGNHTYGAMLANDQRTGFLIPGNLGSRVATLATASSEDLALRYRYDHGRKLTVGGLLTARSAEDYGNEVLSTDLNWRSGSNNVQVQLMHSESEYPRAVQGAFGQRAELSDNAWSAEYDHEGERFDWNVGITDYGRDFRADLGFVPMVDYRQVDAGVEYVWRRTALINEFGVWSDWNGTRDQAGLELEDELEAGFWLEGPWQTGGELWFGQAERYYNGRTFELNYGALGLNSRPWSGAAFGITVRGGDAIDFANTRLAENFSYAPSFTLQLGRHLQTQVNWNHQELDVAGGRLLETDLFDVRVTWQFSNRSFVRAIIIRSDTERNPGLYLAPVNARAKSLNTQLLYSYRFNAQTRFFVGYSDSGVQNDVVTDMSGTDRAVFAKFSYAWQY